MTTIIKTWTRNISFIHVRLCYLSSVANIEKKTKCNKVLKFDKYSLIAASRIESALRRVSDLKRDGRIACPV